ncbi:acyltransferase [Streptomyces spongiicola]|uniref:Acyltransferase n=1 Tax=Streptomyces spongiicola TaxID=1690221 RepID=A0ABN5KQQ7_9ACTN|nr:acyltransferase [Streptomyces spongiicola]AWK10980.1 acyltransferase [Streptomyces spongiicola]
MTDRPKRPGSGTAEAPSRLPALTGMRFVAAALVFFFHANYQGFFADPDSASVFESAVYQGGWTGVGFFFILSGFVLAWSARADDTAPAFLRRRFFKIYPLHLLTFVVAAVLLVQVAGMPFDGGTALLQVLLLQSWSPDIFVRGSFNGVAWSLSCELLFYALFPLLLRLISRIRPERLWAAAGAVVALVFAVPFLARFLPDQSPIPMVDISSAEMWFVYQFPATRLLDFVFGIILARIVAEGRRLPLGFGSALLLTVAAYVVAPYFPPSHHLVAVMLVPLGLLIAAAARADTEGRRTWFSDRGMVRLGEVSFALYLTHQLVLGYGHRLLGFGESWGTLRAVGTLALLFAATLLVSWLLFTLVERPVMRRFGTSRRRAVRVAQAMQAAGPVPVRIVGSAEPAEERRPSLV